MKNQIQKERGHIQAILKEAEWIARVQEATSEPDFYSQDDENNDWRCERRLAMEKRQRRIYIAEKSEESLMERFKTPGMAEALVNTGRFAYDEFGDLRKRMTII